MAQQPINFDPATGDDTTGALRKADNNIKDHEQRLAALGNASTRNVGTAAGTVAAGDDSRFAANSAAAASAQATASAALPLAGGTLTGNVTTAANRASLIVRSNANGVIGNATGSLGGLVVRGTGTGNAPFQTFLSDGFGSYFGVDTDNKLKWGGWSLGNIAYEIWHGGNTTVDGNNFIKRI